MVTVMSVRRSPIPLETIAVTIPDMALEAYEAALGSVCDTVGFFRDDTTGDWRVEGVKRVGINDDSLAAALALAGMVSGINARPTRSATEADGWLARTYASFPEQRIGRRLAIRGTHLTGPPTAGRITLTLDAGLAFGTGEHGSTSGCLTALETVARRKPRRILDVGTGSGILAMAAARLLKRPVLGTDIEPWSVRTARDNARLNHLSSLVRVRLANGWHHPAVRGGGPYDLVFENILARPVCGMARTMATRLAPGGTAILAGLLNTQARMVLGAHLRCGLRLERMVRQGNWTTIVVRKRAGERA
jgi:ribosomal protein L11 methyltransferase